MSVLSLSGLLCVQCVANKTPVVLGKGGRAGELLLAFDVGKATIRGRKEIHIKLIDEVS